MYIGGVIVPASVEIVNYLPVPLSGKDMGAIYIYIYVVICIDLSGKEPHR